MSRKSTSPAAIFTDVRNFITRYCVIGDAEADVVTTWFIHTHQFSPMTPLPHTSPYLYITAPKGSGKTLLGQDLASMLCRNYQSAVGITGAGLFRLVEATDKGTIGIDEIDALYHGAKDEQLRMMLNSGYRRGGTVPRVVAGEVQQFSPYGPKILMGIDNGHLPETVEDRAIRIGLRRATEDEMNSVEPFYSYEVEDEAENLVMGMHDFIVQNGEAIRDYKPTPMAGLKPRQWEIARTLVQLAHVLGVEDRIRESIAKVYAGNQANAESQDSRILRTMRDLFVTHGEKITTSQVLAALETEGITFANGKALGAKLNPLGIVPGTIRLGGETAKGYTLSKCQDTFARYIEG